MTYFMQRAVFFSVFFLGVVIHSTKGDDSACNTKVSECNDHLPRDSTTILVNTTGNVVIVPISIILGVDEKSCRNKTLLNVQADAFVCMTAAARSSACADTNNNNTNTQNPLKIFKEVGIFDKNRLLESINYACSHLEVFERLHVCANDMGNKCNTELDDESVPICQRLSSQLQCWITHRFANCTVEDIAVRKTLTSKAWPPGCVNGGLYLKFSVNMVVFMIVSWLLFGNL